MAVIVWNVPKSRASGYLKTEGPWGTYTVKKGSTGKYIACLDFEPVKGIKGEFIIADVMRSVEKVIHEAHPEYAPIAMRK